jgi:hypothetical protein
MPKDSNDPREKGRYQQLIPDSALSQLGPSRIAAITVPQMQVFEDDPELQRLWDQAASGDKEYRQAYAAVQQHERSFPAALGLKVQIAECSIDAAGRLTFRERIWVPGGEGTASPLRGRII